MKHVLLGDDLDFWIIDAFETPPDGQRRNFRTHQEAMRFLSQISGRRHNMDIIQDLVQGGFGYLDLRDCTVEEVLVFMAQDLCRGTLRIYEKRYEWATSIIPKGDEDYEALRAMDAELEVTNPDGILGMEKSVWFSPSTIDDDLTELERRVDEETEDLVEDDEYDEVLKDLEEEAEHTKLPAISRLFMFFANLKTNWAVRGGRKAASKTQVVFDNLDRPSQEEQSEVLTEVDGAMNESDEISDAISQDLLVGTVDVESDLKELEAESGRVANDVPGSHGDGIDQENPPEQITINVLPVDPVDPVDSGVDEPVVEADDEISGEDEEEDEPRMKVQI